MPAQTFRKRFPPVREILLNKYGPLFNVSSFEELKEVVKRNRAGLSRRQNEVLKLRFFSEWRTTRISSELNMPLQNVHNSENYAFSKVLRNYRSKTLESIGKRKILNMTLSEFSTFIPYHNSRDYARMRSSFSKIKNKKVSDLVEMGPSVVGSGIIGGNSYENLRLLLSEYGINLVGRVCSHFESTINYYMDALSANSISKVAKIFHRYQKFLNPLEVRVIRMRLHNRPLEKIGRRHKFTREYVRTIEANALEKLNFYNTLDRRPYTRYDLLSMDISELCKVIPPSQDYKAARLKKALSECSSKRNLAYFVQNPAEFAKCPKLSSGSYECLNKFLLGHKITIPDLDYFFYMKNIFKKQVEK